jgi:MurNAc alpha-1-phosphate uridylyltransferase
MLLAAGRGERMRPLTLAQPKPLLHVGGRALIDYHLERLADFGIREVVINTHWLGDQLREHCADGERWGLRIRYSDEATLLETAGGIIAALPLLGADPFLVLNADVWIDVDLQVLCRAPLPCGAARLLLVENPPHHPAGDFSLEGDAVQLRGEHTLTFSGLGLYDRGFFDGYPPGPRPLLPLLQAAIAGGRLFGELHRGPWVDVGTPQRLQELDSRLRAAADRQAGAGTDRAAAPPHNKSTPR